MSNKTVRFFMCLLFCVLVKNQQIGCADVHSSDEAHESGGVRGVCCKIECGSNITDRCLVQKSAESDDLHGNISVFKRSFYRGEVRASPGEYCTGIPLPVFVLDSMLSSEIYDRLKLLIVGEGIAGANLSTASVWTWSKNWNCNSLWF